MITMDDFFSAWGKHFGDPNFKQEISLDERINYLRLINAKFVDKDDIIQSLFIDPDIDQYQKHEWRSYVEAFDPEYINELCALSTLGPWDL